jgi:hypothetical protein
MFWPICLSPFSVFCVRPSDFSYILIFLFSLDRKSCPVLVLPSFGCHFNPPSLFILLVYFLSRLLLCYSLSFLTSQPLARGRDDGLWAWAKASSFPQFHPPPPGVCIPIIGPVPWRPKRKQRKRKLGPMIRRERETE